MFNHIKPSRSSFFSRKNKFEKHQTKNQTNSNSIEKMSIKLPFKARLSKIPNAPITLFLHGFLGSHKNYIRLTRHIHKTLNHSTYSMDFRNHGDAPHIFPMDYTTLTSDIQSFCNEHSLHKVNIVGYSMGAKVGMSLALQNPNLVEKLICIDNAPVQ